MNPPQGHEALLKPNKPMSTTAVEPLLLRIRQDVGAWNNPSLPTPEFLRVGNWRVPPSPLMQAFNSEVARDRKRAVEGKGVSVRLDLGCRLIIKQKTMSDV